jgi:hypothetical protein
VYNIILIVLIKRDGEIRVSLHVYRNDDDSLIIKRVGSKNKL